MASVYGASWRKPHVTMAVSVAACLRAASVRRRSAFSRICCHRYCLIPNGFGRCMRLYERFSFRPDYALKNFLALIGPPITNVARVKGLANTMLGISINYVAARTTTGMATIGLGESRISYVCVRRRFFLTADIGVGRSASLIGQDGPTSRRHLTIDGDAFLKASRSLEVPAPTIGAKQATY